MSTGGARFDTVSVSPSETFVAARPPRDKALRLTGVPHLWVQVTFALFITAAGGASVLRQRLAGHTGSILDVQSRREVI